MFYLVFIIFSYFVIAVTDRSYINNDGYKVFHIFKLYYRYYRKIEDKQVI